MIYIIFPRDVLYDTDISYMPTWEPFIDFLGKDIVKDIIDFHVTSHDYRVCAKLRFNSERFRRYAIERLAKISGLV